MGKHRAAIQISLVLLPIQTLNPLSLVVLVLEIIKRLAWLSQNSRFLPQNATKGQMANLKIAPQTPQTKALESKQALTAGLWVIQ